MYLYITNHNIKVYQMKASTNNTTKKRNNPFA